MIQSYGEPVNTRSEDYKIQNSLNRRGKWADKWLMEFSLEKYKVMRPAQPQSCCSARRDCSYLMPVGALPTPERTEKAQVLDGATAPLLCTIWKGSIYLRDPNCYCMNLSGGHIYIFLWYLKLPVDFHSRFQRSLWKKFPSRATALQDFVLQAWFYF